MSGQRGLAAGKARPRSRCRWTLRKSNAAGPQPSGPARTPYGVHMRNTGGPQRGTWATYITTARERAALTKSELARRVGKDRATVGRWEDGKNRPDDADLVARVADVLGLDLDEALAAAGLRPGVTPPPTPTVEVDEEIDLVRTDKRLDPDMKRRIIALILERRERDRIRNIEETRRMIDLMRRPD